MARDSRRGMPDTLSQEQEQGREKGMREGDFLGSQIGFVTHKLAGTTLWLQQTV